MTKTKAPVPTEVEGVKVGDFFSSSWGYDQTNVDFYKVVGLTAKRIKVQKWKSAVVRDDGPQTYVVPGDGPATYIDWSGVDQNADYWTKKEQKVEREVAVEIKTVKRYGKDSVGFTVNSFSGASKWDGKPEYETGVGFGH